MSTIKFHGTLLLSLALLPSMSRGDSAGAEFSSIAQRNVFALREPELMRKREEIEPELPQVSLQGVSSLLGVRQALLKIQTKAKSAAVEVCCVLSEGQVRNGVKILRVEIESGTVWLANQGREQVLQLR